MAKKPTRESVLIAGASDGVGAATAERLSRAGYKVFGTVSAPPPSVSPRYRIVTMDAGNTASIAAAIDSVITQAGRIDAFVNAIGSPSRGAIEDVDPNDLVALFEANVLGPLRVCQAVIPIMRRQKAGRIVHLSSLAARVGVPLQGAYSATRAALSRLSDSMSLELAPHGIRVTTIEPDDTKIDAHASPAEKIAQLVERVLRARNPKARYEASHGRDLFRWMQPLLPDRSHTPRVGVAYEGKASKADLS